MEQETIYEIDFGNHLRAKIKVTGNKIEIIGAINGWGDAVPKDQFKITEIDTSHESE